VGSLEVQSLVELDPADKGAKITSSSNVKATDLISEGRGSLFWLCVVAIIL